MVTSSVVVNSESERKSPIFALSLSYRFNQNADRRRNGRPDSGDGGGGMELDF